MNDPSPTRPAHGGNLQWAATLARCSPSAILDFSASINPLGPPAAAIASIQRHLADLVAYPDPSYTACRAAIGQAHHLPPDWILPGNGAAELLTWISRDLAQYAEVLLPTPAFGDYQRALKAERALIRRCPLPLTAAAPVDLHTLLTTAIAQLTVSPRDCALLLNNPHNPTGQLYDRATLQACLDLFGLVVIDEAFMDFLPPDQQQGLNPYELGVSNLIILRSLTKFYSLPGLRMGYAIAPPHRIQQWQTWRDPWAMNTLAAIATATCLADEAFQNRTWAWLPPARSHLYEGLQQLPDLEPWPGAANFLLVKSGRSVSTLQQQLLLNDQILLRDCLSFPELGDRYFRVAVKSPADNQRLLAALTRAIAEP